MVSKTENSGESLSYLFTRAKINDACTLIPLIPFNKIYSILLTISCELENKRLIASHLWRDRMAILESSKGSTHADGRYKYFQSSKRCAVTVLVPGHLKQRTMKSRNRKSPHSQTQKHVVVSLR